MSEYPVQTLSFDKAIPVWPIGRDNEMNLWLSFRTVVEGGKKTVLRMTASTAYDVKINGRFLCFGPARSAHGYYRVDELDLTPYVTEKSVITITVAGYACDSFYHIDQPSFLTAELFEDGEITVATGSDNDFLCRVMTEHEQKAMRYSSQRTFVETYNMTPVFEKWDKDTEFTPSYLDFAITKVAPMEEKAYIARATEYNTYDRIPASKIVSRMTFETMDYRSRMRYPGYVVPRIPNDFANQKQYAFAELDSDPFITAANIHVTDIQNTDEDAHAETIEMGHGVTYKMPNNTTGKVVFDVTCDDDAEITFKYDEFLNEDGLINFRRSYTVNTLVFRLKKGKYHLATFEPYTMGVMQIFSTKGSFTVSNLGIIYFGASKPNKKYNGSDKELEMIFNAAVETYRQNTFSIFMDCPGRERAGWLCDSFFTARVEKVLTGESTVERAFLENFFMPDSFKGMPKGMFSECYPGDHYSGSYIANWAMWLVLELEEYLKRSGDRTLVDNAKCRIDALLQFFLEHENKYGLVEIRNSWVFVEWSKANQLTKDVNFPTNMLYARMLVAIANLYGDKSLIDKANKIRTFINENTVTADGFYCDNGIYDENGDLQLSGECTEVCQYYAFFCGTTTPEKNPTLWRRMVDDFGPERVVPGKWPELKPEAKWQKIYAANAFIGNYLRLELLYRYGEHQKLVDNIHGFFIKMAKLTGTLWEMDSPTASCNHGFASHVLYWMDGLGMID